MTTPPQGSPIAYEKTLAQVVEILTSVKATLNIDVTTCQGCGQEHRNNWNQYQAAEALNGAITRVQRASSLISQTPL